MRRARYARGELHKVGILDYIDPIILSGDYGYRKPDRACSNSPSMRSARPPRASSTSGTTCIAILFPGARQAGMQTLMFDSDQGTKEYDDCMPDHRIADYRDLLSLLGNPADSGRR